MHTNDDLPIPVIKPLPHIAIYIEKIVKILEASILFYLYLFDIMIPFVFFDKIRQYITSKCKRKSFKCLKAFV